MSRFRLAVLIAIAFESPTRADDWPMFGRDRTHNAVGPEKGTPTDWQNQLGPEKGLGPRAARNIKWTARLGSSNLGGPVIANGLVWVGTNNYSARDPHSKKDASVLMCFRESDGKFLWKYVSPRLSKMFQDGPRHSMGSTPLVEGDRLWLITNRCETLCLNIGPLRRGEGPPREVWKTDMRTEFGVFPHAILMAAGLSPSPATDGDRLFTVTGNGVDEDHITIPAPDAPSLICFDKRSGRALWKDYSPGKDIMESQRSSPLVIEAGGRVQVVIGQGDGWLRSFESESGKLIWKCDLNPKGAKFSLGGRGRKNYIMATPVYYDGRVYIAPGQDPEHGEGENELFCIDPTGTGDVSAELSDGRGKGKPNPNSRVLWRYGGPASEKEQKELERSYLFSRTLANCTIQDGLVYACEIDGYVFCLDALTGHRYWWHDTKAGIWSAPLWADGKVYLGTEDGDIWIFAHGREKKILNQIQMDEPIRVTPIYANGILYVMTNASIYAIHGQR